MESKVMNVFYGADCLPYKDSARSVHYPIVGQTFKGASETTEIHFYVKEIGDVLENTWVANTTLPNGKIGYKLLDHEHDDELDEDYLILPLSRFYTQQKGDIYISLNGYDGGVELVENEDNNYYIEGNPVIQTTGSIKITIAFATQPMPTDIYEYISLDDILAYISGLASQELLTQKLAELKSYVDTQDNGLQGQITTLNTTKADISKSVPKIKASGSSLIKETLLQYGYNADTVSNYIPFTFNLERTDESNYKSYLICVWKIMQDDDLPIIAGYAIDLHAGTNFKYGELGLFTLRQDTRFSTLIGQIAWETTPKQSQVNTFGKSIQLSIDENYDLVVALKDANGNTISTSDVDLPLESLIVDGSYDSTTKSIILELDNGETITIPVGDLVDGLVDDETLALELKPYIKNFEIAIDTTAQDIYDEIGLSQPFSFIIDDTLYFATLYASETQQDYYQLRLQSANGVSWTTDFQLNELMRNVIFDIDRVETSYNPIVVVSNPLDTLTNEQMSILDKANSCISYSDRTYFKAHDTSDSMEFVCVDYDDETISTTNKRYTKYEIIVNKTAKTLNVLTSYIAYYDKDQIDTLLGGKQNTLTFDTTPTQDSTNPITSGGVYQALQNLPSPTNVYEYKGSLTVAQINALDVSTLQSGWVYNVSDSGTITLGSVRVNAGDNIAYIVENNVGHWDNFASGINLSAYATKNGTIPYEIVSENTSIDSYSTSDERPQIFKYTGYPPKTLVGYISKILIGPYYSWNFQDTRTGDIYSGNTSGTAPTFATILATPTKTFVDTSSAQTISGVKTFSARPVFNQGIDTWQLIRQGSQRLYFDQWTPTVSAKTIKPLTANDDLGTSTTPWQDLYLSRNLTDGTNSVSVSDISNGIFNVINASDIVDNTLTQEQFDLITNGKPTLIKGFILGRKNIVIFSPYNDGYGTKGLAIYNNNQENYFTNFGLMTFSINNSSKVISLTEIISMQEGGNRLYLNSSRMPNINSKNLPTYPTTNKSPQVLTIGANGGSLSWNDPFTPTSVSLTDGGTISDTTLQANIQYHRPIVLNGFTCYFSCDDGTNYQYVSTRYDSNANKNHINVITIDKSTWVATFHTSDIALN